MSGLGKFFACIGASILFLGALFHASGVPLVKSQAALLESSFLQAAIEPVWLLSAIHWLVFAVVSCVLVFKRSHHTRIILFILGIAVLADGVLVLCSVGPFIGGAMLCAAGGALLFSALFTRQTS